MDAAPIDQSGGRTLEEMDQEYEVEKTSAIAVIESSRAVQEVQAALVIAKKFPRNEIQAEHRIMRECQRFDLAKIANYTYPRAGKSVTGPSIRLAEAIARHWGNIKYGFRQLEMDSGRSMFQAFCWDQETNVQAERIFYVDHIREKKSGNTALTDPRDVYEIGANQSQRRVRACILEVIPGYIVDKAVIQCRETLKNGEGSVPLVDRVSKMARAFQEKFGVSISMLEKRLGKPLSDMGHDEFVELFGVFNSIEQGNSDKEQWFGGPTGVDKASSIDDHFKD